MQKDRLSKKEYYLNIAKAVSERSTCLRRRYGAVIVKNDEIIATGYNGSPRGEFNCCEVGICKRDLAGAKHNDGHYDDCNSVHAEMNAIISAARKDMIDSTLYLYGYDLKEHKDIEHAEPCPICARLIRNAGLKFSS